MRRTYKDSASQLKRFIKNGDQEGGVSKLGYGKFAETRFLDFAYD